MTVGTKIIFIIAAIVVFIIAALLAFGLGNVALTTIVGLVAVALAIWCASIIVP